MTNPEQSAFPLDNSFEQIHVNFRLGITKREYIAALTMQGLLASGRMVNIDAIAVAQKTIEITDELLKQLEETK